MPAMTQDTIALLDNLNEGDCIEIQYDDGKRKKWSIGKFDELAPTFDGEWCIWLKHRLVGIRMIDVVHIDRLEKYENKAR